MHYGPLDDLKAAHGYDENARRMLARIDEELQKPPKQRKRRFGFANDQFFFKSQAQMNELFSRRAPRVWITPTRLWIR